MSGNWNVRNELKLPLKYDQNVSKLDLDCSTPRIQAAMRNLGLTPNDLKLKPKEQSVAPEIAKLRYEANKRQLIKTVNRVLMERKRIEHDGPDLIARKPSIKQLINDSFSMSPRRSGAVTFIRSPSPSLSRVGSQ